MVTTGYVMLTAAGVLSFFMPGRPWVLYVAAGLLLVGMVLVGE
jgi:hypothetical protein